MNKNFFIFERQVREIKHSLQNSLILEIFSYQKYEITIRLQKDKNIFYLNIGLNPKLPYLFIQPDFRIKKPKAIIFPDLEDAHIKNLYIPGLERIVVLEMSSNAIQFVFYGSKPYALLVNSHGKVFGTFGCQHDKSIPNIRNLNIELSPSIETFNGIFNQIATKDLISTYKKHFPILNNNMIKEILFRTGLSLDDDATKTGLNRTQIEKLYDCFNQIISEIKNNPAEIIFKESWPVSLSLVHFKHLLANPENSVKTYSTLNEAWVDFIKTREHKGQYDSLYNACKKGLDRRLNYLKRIKNKMSEHEDLATRKAQAEIKGNLLLTNINQIKSGSSQVILENIFSDERELIDIKLNPAKSIAENANHYFNKFKDIDTIKTTLHIKKETLSHEIKELENLINKLKTITSFKKLSQIHLELETKNILRSETNDKSKKIRTFPRVILDKEWEVFIGKTGHKNDQLTFGFARPWDIWFHAQGVPGSHVILRVPDRNTQLPSNIIEQTAAIAAHYSKYKNEKHAPVIYTQVRYISRIRKAAPGTVKVQQEKVIFVDPLKPL